MIKIAGLQKISLLDYPKQLAAIIFLAGCNFRCPYCHNPDLIEIKPDASYLSTKEVLDFLQKRKKILDGVVITGGEPLLYSELPDFIKEIKDLGYLIKLDTNGTNYQLLKKLIDDNLINYIAMDIKASLDLYDQVSGVKVDKEQIKASIKLIKESGLDYEFRTTVLPRFHNLAEIKKIAKMIEGAKRYYLQRFLNQKTYNPEFKAESSFTDAQLEELKKTACLYIKNTKIRG